VTTTPEDLPDDIAALQAALVVGRAKRIEEAARAARVEAELAVAKAKASDDQAVIAHQQLQIAKLTRQLYGQRSERTVRRLDQMELALEELETSANRGRNSCWPRGGGSSTRRVRDERAAGAPCGCLDRPSVRYQRRRPDDDPLRERLKALAEERRRFGYRQLWMLLRGRPHQ
jgi:hypothetical protein